MRRERRIEDLVEIEVDVEGEIGAGSVVPFIRKGETVKVLVPKQGPDKKSVGTLIVRGSSLEDLEIYDGDILILRNDITRKNIHDDTICAVYIRSTGELLAKRIAFGTRGDIVTLKSSGGGFSDVHYPADDIEVRGIVFGFQRMQNEYGRFNKKPSDDDIGF